MEYIRKCKICKELILVDKHNIRCVKCETCKKLGKTGKYSELILAKRNKKLRQTCLEKYGTDNPSKSKEIKEKIKTVWLEKYGVDHNSKYDKIKEKKKQTYLKNYGVDNNFKADEIKEKIKKTCLEKYGVNNSNKDEKVKEKKKQTFLRKYNVENPLQIEEIKEKIKKTCLEKYGVDNPSKCKEIKEKIKKNYFEKFFSQRLNKLLDYMNLVFIDKEYVNAITFHKFRCKKCGTEFIKKWFEIQQGCRCPTCFPRNFYSKGEKEIVCFIKTILPSLEIVENSRKIIPPYELDIYIPEKQTAIEFNGLYWHSEEFKDNFLYHLTKSNLCKEKDIRLIHIFEDEWIFKQDIVKARVKNILGVSGAKRIHGRNCEIKEINSEIKNKFLEKFHLQGKDTSSINLGAFYKDQLISVMTFSKPNLAKGQKTREEGIWELSRFCSDYNFNIPGIASKLLTYFKKNYFWKEIYSYADRRWSNGNLYYKLNFNLESETRPNYWYIKDFKRIHRFNLRKRPDEPKEIPEWALRTKEGYIRIWDCGNFKFTIQNGE